MIRQVTTTVLAAGTLAFAAPAFAQETPPEEISTAVEAAESAGIIETLTSGGEVTVFVPSNDAIAAAPQDALQMVLSDPALLTSVIQGYAVEGTVMAADAMQMVEDNGGTAEVETLGGTMLSLTMDGESLSVSGEGETMASVMTPDLQFGNITIHVLDGAILPVALPE